MTETGNNLPYFWIDELVTKNDEQYTTMLKYLSQILIFLKKGLFLGASKALSIQWMMR